MNGGPRGEVCIAGSNGDVAADLGPFGEVKIAAEDGGVSGDSVPGVDADAAEEDGYVALDIAVQADGAEYTSNITSRLALLDGNIRTHAGAGIAPAVEDCQRGSGEQQQCVG